MSSEIISDGETLLHVLVAASVSDVSCLFWLCRAYVILKPEFAFPISYYLIPFTGVVCMIILVMCIVFVSMRTMGHGSG